MDGKIELPRRSSEAELVVFAAAPHEETFFRDDKKAFFFFLQSHALSIRETTTQSRTQTTMLFLKGIF